ncbi:hypothetical protein GQ651_04320 [Alphaproteobacteria bacterium GH1-50]|uniref:Flp pilus assembly protein TadG n=1 Tax=Kangsaoukella pontilimi TaxID=2691042 RepID=A0A7C9IEV0_9RHOB|nr:hypothetical protein [Kangsaoukella pontilimi]MXQ07064.1 hypothetical protein [Kangsaoukella pontilimi]
MRISSAIRRFRAFEDGSLSVETVLIFPLLAWALSAMLVFWDGFKVNNNAIAATYTVADLVSRQTSPITDDFVKGADKLYAKIVQNNNDNELRLTVVQMSESTTPGGDPEPRLVWSHGTSGLPAREKIEDITAMVPLMAVGTSMIMVETASDWTPPFDIDFASMTFRNVFFSSPRYVPQVKFDNGGDDSIGFVYDDGDAA